MGGPDGASFAEPRLLEALDHPHIPPVREAQFDPRRHNCVTFVMPCYPGGSVARALGEDHSFSLHETLSVIRDVLDALEYVHTVHRHLHRDVKTSNVLLDERRQAGFLSDFERAAPMADDGSTQAILATPFYMAPECARSGRHTVRSDIYGVGVILFEMLNGRFPWESFSRTEIERRILAGQRSFPDRLVAPAAFAPEIPDELVRITRKAISRDPPVRFASARAFLDALNQARCIDWRRQARSGSDRGWTGAWPPLARPSARDHYRVTSRLLTSGKHKNELRPGAVTPRSPDGLVTIEHSRHPGLGP